MSNDKDWEICLSRKEFEEIFRTLEALVVSLDRIGSYTQDLPPEQAHRILWDYMSPENAFRPLARCRHILSKRIDASLTAAQIAEFEASLEDVPIFRWPPTSSK